MPKMVFWIGLVFGLVGTAIMIGGGFSLNHSRSFSDGGVSVQGVVVDLAYSRDSDGDGTYAPVVEYRDREGRPHTYRSSSGSSPPSYDVGERVTILYRPDQPSRAVIDDFWDRWALPAFLLGFGAIFAVVGWGLALAYYRRRWTVAKLRTSGVPTTAKVVECYRDTSTTINGRSPWKVAAQGTNPVSGKIDSFTSDPIWVDLSAVLKDKTVPVMVDRDNPAKHWVDLSTYVDEDEELA
jgi:hypothetical protein